MNAISSTLRNAASGRTIRHAAAIAIISAVCVFGKSAEAQVVVYTAPPPPPVVRVVPRPAPGYVWVAGYYAWTGGRYVWVSGHWVVPPRPAVVWVPAHWTYVPASHSYVFVAGVWR